MASGTVFDIQHFAIHDGPGIRTTVFLKGCPLRCLWCHNPEGQEARPEIFYSPEKCIGCRFCESACRHGLHTFSAGAVDGTLEHAYLRDDCVRCGECTRECYAGALELCGREMSAGEVLAEVLKDRPFYESSGGGLTISGGEPLQQFEFTAALLGEARAAGLHTVVETCGAGPTERFLALVPLVDLFYFDVKESDPALHRRYTGVGNDLILANLAAVDAAGASTVLRCPVIPGLNDRAEHFAAVAALAGRLRGVQAVHVLPYHALGTNKHRRLGKPPVLEASESPSPAQVAGWVRDIGRGTRVTVLQG